MQIKEIRAREEINETLAVLLQIYDGINKDAYVEDIIKSAALELARCYYAGLTGKQQSLNAQI